MYLSFTVYSYLVMRRRCFQERMSIGLTLSILGQHCRVIGFNNFRLIELFFLFISFENFNPNLKP